MNARVRLALILVIVAILLYFVISQPEAAAETVRSIVDSLVSGVEQIIRFVRGVGV